MHALELYPERNCSTCTAEKKKEWGCTGNAVLPVSFKGENMFTCIRRPILDNPRWFNEILTMYKMYKNGFLPNDGPWLAQPLGVITAINVLDAAVHECDKIKEESAQNKRKAQGRKNKMLGKKN